MLFAIRVYISMVKSWIFQCCGNVDGKPKKTLTNTNAYIFKHRKLFITSLVWQAFRTRFLFSLFACCSSHTKKNERQKTRYHVYKPSAMKRILWIQSYNGWKETTRARWDDKWFWNGKTNTCERPALVQTHKMFDCEFCWRNCSQVAMCAFNFWDLLQYLTSGVYRWDINTKANHFTCCCFHKIVAAKLRITSNAQCACRQLHGAGILIV